MRTRILGSEAVGMTADSGGSVYAGTANVPTGTSVCSPAVLILRELEGFRTDIGVTALRHAQDIASDRPGRTGETEAEKVV